MASLEHMVEDGKTLWDKYFVMISTLYIYIIYRLFSSESGTFIEMEINVEIKNTAYILICKGVIFTDTIFSIIIFSLLSTLQHRLSMSGSILPEAFGRLEHKDEDFDIHVFENYCCLIELIFMWVKCIYLWTSICVLVASVNYFDNDSDRFYYLYAIIPSKDSNANIPSS